MIQPGSPLDQQRESLLNAAQEAYDTVVADVRFCRVVGIGCAWLWGICVILQCVYHSTLASTLVPLLVFVYTVCRVRYWSIYDDQDRLAKIIAALRAL